MKPYFFLQKETKHYEETVYVCSEPYVSETEPRVGSWREEALNFFF